jgi:indole-3-glycerol phosphate synthase
MSILDQIVAAKRRSLIEAKAGFDVAALPRAAEITRKNRPPFALREALSVGHEPRIIAEIKRRSPSKGDLRPKLVAKEIAREYIAAGAAAVSVLTEADHFGGSLYDLAMVRQATARPILRKDFTVDRFQVYETALTGADALLLIVAILSDAELEHFLTVTEDLGMDALVEVHTDQEMERALEADARVIGINNRDLETFEVSLETSYRLAKMAPKETVLVSESGITTPAQLRDLRAAGFSAFLIGETLMRAASPGEALRGLIEAT